MIGRRIAAALVHVYTASGVLLALAATIEICSAAPDPRFVFLALAAAVMVDATDGPLARRADVKRWMPNIDGRTIDDIVDYLTYTFLPLLLVWRMGWLPEPGPLWVLPALLASLFGFANPNLAPRPWKVPVLAGALLWLGILFALVADYPRPPAWLFWLSLLYPA